MGKSTKRIMAEKQQAFKPMVYICATYRGDTDKHVQDAIWYAEFAYHQGNLPITPHLFFPFLNEDMAEHRQDALAMDLILLGKCQEVWVFGDCITNGMKEELIVAKRRQQPIKYFNKECVAVDEDSLGNKRTDKLWKNSEITWDEFCDRLKTPIITSESVSDYQKMPKSQQDDIKDVGGFVAGHLKQGRRKKGHVLSRSMITLDMYFGTIDIWEELTLLFPYRCALYSTHSHRKDNPRYRLIIPLSRDVSSEEYGAVARMLAKEIGIYLFDVTTYDVERLMYLPSVSKDGDYLFEVQNGSLLNPDDVLKKYDDWTDITTWSVSSKESQVIKKTATTQKDPLTKEGEVGAFCRTYSVTETIEKFLTDIYQPSTVPNRYDHIGSASSAGVVVYDDKFVYIHHASDPASGKLLNAFDLVRVHKFGDEDKKEMWEFASLDDAVKMTLLEELIESSNGKPMLVAYWFQSYRYRVMNVLMCERLKPLKTLQIGMVVKYLLL